MIYPLLLGSHVSMSGKKMLLGSSEEAASYGANTFMIYTGAPQNTRRKPIEELNIEAGSATYEGKWNIKYRCPCSVYYQSWKYNKTRDI